MPRNKLCSLAISIVTAMSLSALVACGGDDDHSHDVHVQVTAAPPATPTAGTAFDVSWQVHNMSHDDLHHTEIRVCEGTGVMDCGLGDTSTYTSFTGTMANGTFTASVTLDTAGGYTLAAWCHVGADPHVSDMYDVTAQ